MNTDIGEFVVGAYLRIIEGCDFVEYNVRPLSTGMEGLSEFDVIGFNFQKNTVFLCEVATHLFGLDYGLGREKTINKIQEKFQRQKIYADKYLSNFSVIRLSFWSPVVTQSMVDELKKIEGLELIVNNEYTNCINKLKIKAREEKSQQLAKDYGNPFFRMLQILENLR